MLVNESAWRVYVVCTCQWKCKFAKLCAQARVCVCVYTQGSGVCAHESSLWMCGRVIPVQDASEQGAPSATPPVSSDSITEDLSLLLLFFLLTSCSV